MDIEDGIMREILESAAINVSYNDNRSIKYYKKILINAMSSGKYIDLFKKYFNSGNKDKVSGVNDIQKDLNNRMQYYVDILNNELALVSYEDQKKLENDLTQIDFDV